MTVHASMVQAETDDIKNKTRTNVDKVKQFQLGDIISHEITSKLKGNY